jgi:hypothetical protein
MHQQKIAYAWWLEGGKSIACLLYLLEYMLLLPRSLLAAHPGY